MILAACQDGVLPESLTQGDISLLYKKGDTRDARNYRPITLLQVDYKIFAKMLVAKIKKVVHTFVFPQQLGFVPKRLIGEASHLRKLIQAYLDEVDEEGIILALDWEKAFDRVSWQYYHSALEALEFGPNFRLWAKLLADPDNPPSRCSKINGKRSLPFCIHSGVPQGCPFSPLAFLIIAEALTRMLVAEEDIEGITINGIEHRISQFADDTQLLLKNFNSFEAAFKCIALYEKASGMRINKGKYVGILTMRQHHKEASTIQIKIHPMAKAGAIHQNSRHPILEHPPDPTINSGTTYTAKLKTNSPAGIWQARSLPTAE
jgi:hypothetical protein